MANIMDKILSWGLVVMAVVAAWAVLTPHHLYVG